MLFTYLSLAATLTSVVLATPTPLTPATAAIGATCKIQWDADTTGLWKDTTISLKSGPNQAMVLVTTVVTGLDTTSDSSTTEYDWTCPDVTPTSAIYFYEFALANLSDPTWTTRFAISAADGTVTTPTHATQPNGDAIPWGTGALVGAVSGNSTSSTSKSSGASSSTASSTTANSSSPASASSSASQSTTPASSSSSSPRFTTTSSPTFSSSSSSSSSSPATSTTTTGAATKQNEATGLLMLFVGGVALLVV